MDKIAVIHEMRRQAQNRLREYQQDEFDASYTQGRLDALEQVLRLEGQEDALRREEEISMRAADLAAHAHPQAPFIITCYRCRITTGHETVYEACREAAQDGWHVMDNHAFCEHCP